MSDLWTAVTALVFSWPGLVAVVALTLTGVYSYSICPDPLDLADEALSEPDLQGNEDWHDSRPSWEQR